ncbi:Glycine--tRNA ligase 1, mitochondrial [Pseudocercospora fuligena]|uniref:glycine--tRNA ligase n=1 Tax=Pseudocercospora fuligena TaxID=685502 RepID=A0A8H6REZ6_9PEZI|nr:Glycine--tRNA ligase 1, mitochondrial [Pseudocercospora fuligena]
MPCNRLRVTGFKLSHFSNLFNNSVAAFTPSVWQHRTESKVFSAWKQFSTSGGLQRFQVPVRTRNTGTRANMASEYKTLSGGDFDRTAFESLLRRKCFLWQSFEPYGATKGLFDYGPPLETIEAEFVNIWRDHFIRTEKMMALKCSMLTPYKVLETSGHVAKFADYMCKDPKTGEILRSDHLIKDVIETRLKGDREARGEKIEEDAEAEAKKKKKNKNAAKTAVKLDDAVVKEYEHLLATLDDQTGEDMGALIRKHDIRNPSSGNQVEDPVSVNLMFQTQIGASGKEPAFLRPETAQGQFLSFQKLLEYSDGQLPFASASIGYSFRNELSPRSGLLRVREFLMAEVEHFVDPLSGKKHPKFDSVRDVKLPLLARDVQQAGGSTPSVMTIGEAVDKKVVDNETLGYFLVRIMLFMERIGIDMKKLRFRQHMANEMAHYAADCWDCELFNSYGWIECVGCADRSAYDLSVHAKATGVPLEVRERLDEPKKVEEWIAQLDKKKSGPKFKKDAGKVQAALDNLSQELKEKLSISLQKDGKVEVDVADVANGKVELESDIVKIEKETRTETMRTYTPNVIEPSFGIGRILYSLMEHVYWTRDGDEARSVMSFKPSIAPVKVLVVPLQKDTKFAPLLRELEQRLDDAALSFKVDQSGVSIGKRYSRNDELGIPFGITVDYESLEGKGFTLRDRDSTKQVRSSLDDIIGSISQVVAGKATWADIQKKLPAFESKGADE